MVYNVNLIKYKSFWNKCNKSLDQHHNCLQKDYKLVEIMLLFW